MMPLMIAWRVVPLRDPNKSKYTAVLTRVKPLREETSFALYEESMETIRAIGPHDASRWIMWWLAYYTHDLCTKRPAQLFIAERKLLRILYPKTRNVAEQLCTLGMQVEEPRDGGFDAYVEFGRRFAQRHNIQLTFPDELLTFAAELRIEDGES